MGKGEHPRDAVEHFAEAGELSFQMTDTGIGEPVDARGAALGREALFGLEQALAEHALKCGVERAFFNLKEVVGDLFYMFHESVAVHWLLAK